MKSWKIILSIVRSVVLFLFMFEFCLAKLNICNLIKTKDRKITPSSSTLKIETAPSSMACSIMCCNLESCCYASYDNKTRQCILDESCCPQSELTGDALMMKKSTGSLQCQNGWLKNETNCYFFSNDAMNWNDAKSVCESYGSMLVEVISSCELDFLKATATVYDSSFWLGGTDIEKEGDWIWSTSQTDITFNDWHVGRPDNWNDQQHCLLLRLRFNLEWDDRSCTDINRFICEKNLLN